MPTSIQLLLVALGIIVGLKYALAGASISTLPGGWFLAENSPYYLEIWLFTCFIFGILLIVQFKAYGHDRSSKIS